MDAARFDRLTRLFAGRRSRRQVVRDSSLAAATGAFAATGLAAATAAQDATPTTGDAASDSPSLLYVQTFQGGAIAPMDGEDGTYTLSLQHPSGQTVYFADRPDRNVGTLPTADFVKIPLFAGDNPPNAALLVEPAPGVTDIAVVELLNPEYDPAAGSLAYDIIELAEYTESLTLGLAQDPTDLATLLPEFGSAHLFIDSSDGWWVSCIPAHSTTYCYRKDTGEQIGPNRVGTFEGRPCGDSPIIGCFPHDGDCRNDMCNDRYPECEGQCWEHSPEIQDCDYCKQF